MAIIRKRQIQLMKAGAFGGVIVFILCGLIYITVLKNKTPNDSVQADANTEAMEYQEVSLLKRPMSANSRITEADYYTGRIQKQLVPDGVLQAKDFVGKYLKLSLGRNCMIIDELVSDREISNDLRIHNYNFIKFNDKLSPGEYVDIRISFADGADYVLLSKKCIIDLTRFSAEVGTENCLWLEVGEEEILRLSSAAVDAYLQEGCSIYAIKYIESVQNALIVNYPVNDTVRQLIMKDPNIIDKAAAYLNSEINSTLRSAHETKKKETAQHEDAYGSSYYENSFDTKAVKRDEQNAELNNSYMNDIEFLD